MMTKNKYNAKKTIYKGITYDSKKEAMRAEELDVMLSIGKILDIQRQVPLKCIVNNLLVCKLVCDFVYTLPSGEVIHEDVKGMVLPVFKLKQKLVKALLGIEVIIF